MLSMNIPRRALFALSIALFACAAPVRASDDRIHVIVLHTNDVHGQALPRKATWLKRDPAPMIGGLPRIAAYVNDVKSEAAKTKDVVLVVDAGDWFQGTPEGLIDDGAGFVKALAMVGYDAMCVGNHDLDHGIPALKNILAATKVPAVVANLDVKETKKPIEWAPPYRIVERGGLKIALVGLLTPITPEITHPDAQTLDFIDPVLALKGVEKELAGKVDWILPLTHLGVQSDHDLAKGCPGMPLIVGGHSHTYLKDGEREGETRIVQTGSKASAIGRVDLWFDRATKKCVETTVKLVDLFDDSTAANKNAPLEEQCAKLEAQTEEHMKGVVGELTVPAMREKTLVSGTAGNLITDALREYTHADVGLVNRGGIRSDLPAGKITRRDVFEIMPFDNNVTVIKMSGAELLSMMKNAVEGKSHSGIEVSGVTIQVAIDGGGERRVTGLIVGSSKVDPAKEYRVAMNSFMADGGDAFITKVPAGPKRVDDVMLMRDVLEEFITRKGKVTPSNENRFSVTKS